MKREEINKLVELEKKINNLEGYITTMNQMKGTDISIFIGGYTINPIIVPGLTENIKIMLNDVLIKYHKELKSQMEQLVLCTEIKGGRDYLPINI